MTRYYIIAAVVIVLLVWPIHLAVLYSHIGSYKKYWLEKNQLPDTPKQLVYVALGDSTAQGIGASKPTYAYTYLVMQYLEQKTGRPVKLINLSVSGAKVQDAVDTQLPQLVRLKPDIVTIEIGANDIGSFDADRFEASYKKLVAGLPAGTYVSDIPCFTGRSKKLDPKVVGANRIIRQHIADTDLRQVELYDSTQKNTGLRYFAADYFHPSNRAYVNWAKAFTNALDDEF